MESIGGTLEIENENGTTVKLYCPLNDGEEEKNV
jgi:hypothetical protein